MLARDSLRESNRVRQERSDAWSKAGDEIDQDLWIQIGMELGFEDVTLWIREILRPLKGVGRTAEGKGIAFEGAQGGRAPLKYYFYCFYFVAIMINFGLENCLILMRMYRVCFWSWRVEITVLCLFSLLLIKRDRT